MGTIHRFIIAAIAALSSVLWPSSQTIDLFNPPLVLTADAVIPAHVEPRRVSAVLLEECGTDVLSRLSVWGYLRDFLMQQYAAIVRWFSSARLDAVGYRSPDAEHGEEMRR